MTYEKSKGVTPTENLLAELCERTFLKLWSWPNPCKDDGDELCDLIVVFGDTVILFFDREGRQLDKEDVPIDVAWGRWKKKVVDAQIKTAHGAERYIRSGRRIYVDPKQHQCLPLKLTLDDLTIHKVVVAHGAKEACERASDENVYGSLAVTYNKPRDSEEIVSPFFIELDRSDPIHLLDTVNLPILLGELDTIADLTAYFSEKERAIAAYSQLSYCGEEDLLAHYFLNFDEVEAQYKIGVSGREDIGFVHIAEGEWHDFVSGEAYQRRKAANAVSYMIDKLIQRTSDYALSGTLEFGTPLEDERSAIHELAGLPRTFRRVLGERLVHAFDAYSGLKGQGQVFRTFVKDPKQPCAFVFMQMDKGEMMGDNKVYRERRTLLLRCFCGITKNRFPELETIVGVGFEPPKLYESISEDFVLLDCKEWPTEIAQEFEELNEALGFYTTGTEQRYHASDFPDRPKTLRPNGKIGRNEKCPCGSGRKYKKCCLR